MNYEKTYYKIINKALFEEKFGIRYKNNKTYYEKHHIIPKSLGGSNNKNNLVLLTPKEHFICHLLLVKKYDKNTVEYNKMMFALWNMQRNPSKNYTRYINSKIYEKLRYEFSILVGKQNAILQCAEKNSQWGKHWFTNLRTGESNTFKEKPDEFWIEGRNWFYKNRHEIYSIENKQKIYNVKGQLKSNRIYKKDKNKMLKTQNMWDDFHKSNCKSITEYAIIKNINYRTISNKFKRFIPYYNKRNSVCTFKSDYNLIGKYE